VLLNMSEYIDFFLATLKGRDIAAIYKNAAYNAANNDNVCIWPRSAS